MPGIGVCAGAADPSFEGRRRAELEREGGLGGALEPLFLAGSNDDRLAGAEPHGCAGLPVLVPELVESRVDGLQLGGDGWVEGLRKSLPELGAAGALDVDLVMDLL